MSLFLLLEEAGDIVVTPSIRAIVSFDGNLIPAQQQDFIFYTFSESSMEPESLHGMFAKLILQIRNDEKVEETFLLTPIEVKKDGISKASFDIPHNALPGEAELIITDEHSSVLLNFDNQLRVGSTTSLAVIPPESVTFTGGQIKFKMSTFCPKTGEPALRAPIRVQMFSSSEIMTVNRLIHTDIAGNALFTTHVHREAPEGLYRAEFSHGDKRQIFKFHVLGRHQATDLSKVILNTNDTLSAMHANLLQNSNALIAPIKADYQLRAGNENPLLNDFSIEENQIFFKYDSKNSQFRQIEIWQNGKAQFSSELPFVSGRSSLTLPDSVKPDQPALVRLLFANNDRLYLANQSFINPKNSTDLLNPFQDLSLPSSHQNQLMNSLLNSDFSSAIISHGFNSDFSDADFNQTTLEPSQEQLTMFPAIELNNRAQTIVGRSTIESTGSRFAFVDKEIELGKTQMKRLKIWLSPRPFFHSLISNLYTAHSTPQSLATEIEARTLGYNLLTFPEQSGEIERLEGLLLPLSEVMNYFAHHETEADHTHGKILIRAINRLGNLIQIPEQLKQLSTTLKIDDTMIGPAPPVLNYELNISQLTDALRPGGRASIETSEGATFLNLTGESVVYEFSSMGASNKTSVKLVNLRTYPIIVEFISR